ncbi:MAG: hypothetical protein ACK465_00170, partial [Flavobacteriia bacterium]
MFFSLSNALNVQALFEKGDVYTYTAFTFFIGTMAMMAAAAFFFMEMRNMEEKWRTSILQFLILLNAKNSFCINVPDFAEKISALLWSFSLVVDWAYEFNVIAARKVRSRIFF